MKEYVRQFLFAFALLFSLTLIVNAQTKNSPTNDEQPKVVKAAALTKYPFGNFKGTPSDVIVIVKINWMGEVVSATPVSGHPILRVGCKNAAKRWLFESIEDKKRERTVNLVFSFQKVEKDEDSGIFFKPPYTVEFVAVEVR